MGLFTKLRKLTFGKNLFAEWTVLAYERPDKKTYPSTVKIVSGKKFYRRKRTLIVRLFEQTRQDKIVGRSDFAQLNPISYVILSNVEFTSEIGDWLLLENI